MEARRAANRPEQARTAEEIGKVLSDFLMLRSKHPELCAAVEKAMRDQDTARLKTAVSALGMAEGPKALAAARHFSEALDIVGDLLWDKIQPVVGAPDKAAGVAS